MNSRLFFRETGHVVRTHSVARDAAWAFGAIAVLLALLAWGHAVDAQAEAEDLFAAGLAVGQQDLADLVAHAYLQGQRDTLAQQCPAPAELMGRQQRGAL